LLSRHSPPRRNRRGKVARVGVIEATSPSAGRPILDAFREGLRDLGYPEGQNVIIEARWAVAYRWEENRGEERLRELASDLISQKVDVMVTVGDRATQAAKQATTTIPIVFVAGDPVGFEFVTSLARPSGNLIGIALLSVDLEAKRLQLLIEGYPKISRVTVLANVLQPAAYIKVAEDAARVVGVQTRVVRVARPDDFDGALRGLPEGREAGIFVLSSPFLSEHRKALVDAIARRRLPAVYENRDYVDAGGLMSYGPNFRHMFRSLASYVGRILKGAKPADLPVAQPTKLELVINLRTANALGLTIPPSLLLRADG
jgi:putative tryptophan/tyrosine transport system substrate-binding protein